MLEFFGRFHPVLVHLPIGILLLACIFILFSFSKKQANLKNAIPITLLFGAISAVLSCITGYFLSENGDYDHDLVSLHQWMGIAVAALSIILYFIYKKVKSNAVLGTIAIVLIVGISITGHLGGSLTHGSDFLTKPIQLKNAKGVSAIPTLPNVQEAFIYQDAIQPLLKSRCYSCHGAEKQKGKLRLDQEEFILKGGKNGVIIVSGKADESELIRRLNLPLSDEEHMAPKEKPQLTEDEVKLLKWWIDNGADFKKKFKEVPQPGYIKPILANIQKGASTAETVKTTDIPTEEVSAADPKLLKKLTDAGVSVFPVAQNSNYLSANFVNVTALNQEVLDLIKSIDKQLVWLKLEGNKVNDETLKAIRGCKHLTKLSLNYANITDKGLVQLQDLDHLHSLSLVGTKVTVNGIEQLKKLKELQYLYLYQSRVNKADLDKIKIHRS